MAPKEGDMTGVWLRIALVVGAFVAMFSLGRWVANPDPIKKAPATFDHVPTLYETEHFTVASTARPEQARLVAERVEMLRIAFVEFFPNLPAHAGRHQVALYRDRAEFQAHNTSQPWAEAYYRAPVAHAYLDPSVPNPTHWMLHEATHQLSRELAQFPKSKWSDEGLATYFSTSVIRDGRLVPGELDPDTYPLWWVRDLPLGGKREDDFAANRLVPLRALITDRGGPPIAKAVNAYYIGYWSLAHFLVHGEGGRHAAAFKALVATGGGLEDFERTIGPVDEVEARWYAYLQARVADLRRGADDASSIVVDQAPSP
jgi:hypothetical protein